MPFPGLTPTLVRVSSSPPEVKDLDPSRSAVLVNPETLTCIQAEKGGTSEKPPKGFVDLRDLSDEEFERIIRRLVGKHMPDGMVQGFREYRTRISKTAT